MIAWTIEACIEANIFTDIIVSTDDPQIAQIAKEYGAQVPFFREGKYADDYTPVSDATLASLMQMEELTTNQYDIVFQLMPNCPCRKSADILDAYNQFQKKRREFQISVFKFGWMNPWWALKYDSDSNPIKLFPEAYQKRSQDLDELYCPTGAIWISQCSSLKRDKTFYGNGFGVHQISWQSAVDIDDYDDLDMAKSVFFLRNKGGF